MPELHREMLNFLANLDRNPPAHAPRDNLPGGVHDLAEPDLAGHVRKLPPMKISPQPPPSKFPIRFRPHDRVDAEQRYASQNKRSYGSRQIHPTPPTRRMHRGLRRRRRESWRAQSQALWTRRCLSPPTNALFPMILRVRRAP